MGVEAGAKFTITAGVVGQQAVDRLRTSVGGVNDAVTKLPGLAKTAGLALVGLGAGLGLATIKSQFDGMIQSMTGLKDASERVGTTVENMGALAAVAKVTGDDLGTVEAGIIKMNKALAGSDDETKGAARALDAIGLSIKDLRSLDPAEAFKRIAGALGQFENNGAKTALVMDIFGKSGAQLLPFLNDYVELSGLASKTTSDQAEMADQYERNLRKLQAAQQDLYKVVATQALPVANDFIQALLDVGLQTNGVKDSARSLAADGSLRTIFEEAARAGAAFLDVASNIVKAIAQIGDSIGVVMMDLKTGAKVAGLGLGAGFTEEGQAAIKQALAEREAYVTEANKRLAERWDAGMTPFTDALEKRFADRKQAEAGKGSQNEPPKKRLVYGGSGGGGGGGGGGGSDPYTTELQSLGREAAKLQWQTQHIDKFAEKITSAKEAQVQFDIEQGKFKDLSAQQKEALLAAARAVDQHAESLRQAQVGLEVTKQTEAIKANTAAMGLNTRDRELAALAQDLENKGIKEGTDLYNRLTEARRAALQEKADARANPLLGIKEGMAELGDEVNDRATQMKNVLTNAFDGAADALTEFVMTGKLNFADFARSVIADLAKMIIKQMLFNSLSALTGGGGLFGLKFASGGAFDSGGLKAFASGGVVDSPTLFKFAQGGTMRNGLMGEAGPEAIMPLKRGRDGKLGVVASGSEGGGVTIGSIVVQGDGNAKVQDTSGKNAAALARDLGATIDARILHHRRPGGLLAA